MNKEEKAFPIQEEMGHSSPNHCSKGTFAALVTGLGTAPSTLNTTVNNRIYKKVLHIRWQVPWSKEKPVTVTISRTKVCGGHVV